ncbi:MAG: CpaF family protein, partial [Candidatus Omnitrophica bacterium]|nr:CpaF family protein [Candidatus Omnitrophota bacterium]
MPPIEFEYEEIKARLHRFLIAKTDFLKVKDAMNEDQLRFFVDGAITRLSQEAALQVSFEIRAKLIRELVGAVASLGPLRSVMDDRDVSEIMVNGYKSVYVQKNGKMQKTGIHFDDNAHLLHTVQKLLAAAGTSRRVDESSPYVDFSMADG